MNSLETLTTFFGWTVVLNFSLLLFTTLGMVSARRFISRIHGRMFGLDNADLSQAYFQYLAQYKIATIVFSFAPYVALKLMA